MLLNIQLLKEFQVFLWNPKEECYWPIGESDHFCLQPPTSVLQIFLMLFIHLHLELSSNITS
jgi:hypothetical protein